MISLLLIALGHTAYGVTNTLWKNPQEEIGTLPLIMFRSFYCFVVFFSSHFLLTNFGFLSNKSFSNQDLLQTIGICYVNYFGLFFYLKSLQHTQISNTIGFGKLSLIIAVLVGFFIYKETLSISKILVCIGILIAISLIEKGVNAKREKLSKGLIYTTLSRLFWSTAFLFPFFIEKVGVMLFCAILEACVFTMSLFLFIFQTQKPFINPKKLSGKTIKELVLLVILGCVGTFCLNFAIMKTDIIVFAFLGLIEPIIGLIISYFYHQERINKLQFIGLSLGLVSSFVLSIL